MPPLPPLASWTHSTPHCPHRGFPQSRTPPDIHGRCAHSVETSHDGEQIGGFVPKCQTSSYHKSDDNIDKRGVPQHQEAYNNQYYNSQRLLLTFFLGTWRVSINLESGNNIQFDSHYHFGEYNYLNEDDAEHIQLYRFGKWQQIPSEQVGKIINPAVDVNAYHKMSCYEAAVGEWITHSKIPVKLCKQKCQYIDP